MVYQKLQKKIMVAVVAGLYAVMVVALGALSVTIEGRVPNIPRQRMEWATRLGSLTRREFKRRYRLSGRAFATLSQKIEPLLARKPRGQNPISTDLRLSMALRYLSAGNVREPWRPRAARAGSATARGLRTRIRPLRSRGTGTEPLRTGATSGSRPRDRAAAIERSPRPRRPRRSGSTSWRSWRSPARGRGSRRGASGAHGRRRRPRRRTRGSRGRPPGERVRPLEGRPSSPGRCRTKPPKLNPGYGDESWLLRRLQDYDISLAAIPAAAES